MIFTTPAFAIFMAVFMVFWLCLPMVKRRDKLLIASYGFYAAWDIRFLSLILISTLVDYLVGRQIDRTDAQSARKRLLAISVVSNLGLLAFFKYCNFFIGSAQYALETLGMGGAPWALDIILPVGISFYTFQTLSYTIDIYRGRLKHTESLLDFALFVAFFPQLVAGPIERASRLLPQIRSLESARPIWSGLFLIALGCFKKAAIADNIAAVVDPVFADPLGAYSPAVWVATYAFAIQIYFDFSGYSDIAVGLARLFGIKLMQNFKAPYAALGPSDFWRRWHISLSSWLRDYLYISLGGNRLGRILTLRNLLLTMLLGGLWHGAAWNFVLWGAWHGCLLIIFRQSLFGQLNTRLETTLPTRLASRLIRRLVFFHLVCIGWALFRLEAPNESFSLLGHMLSPEALNLNVWFAAVHASGEALWLKACGFVIVATLAAQWIWPHGSDKLADLIWRAPDWLKVVAVSILLYGAMVSAPESQPPFIYFQF